MTAVVHVYDDPKWLHSPEGLEWLHHPSIAMATDGTWSASSGNFTTHGIRTKREAIMALADDADNRAYAVGRSLSLLQKFRYHRRLVRKFK